MNMKKKRKEARPAPSARRASDAGGTAKSEKRAEAVRDAEGVRLLSVLDGFPGPVWLQASDYTVCFANRRFREIFRDAEGRRCHALFHGREEPCSPCLLFDTADVSPSKHGWTAPDGCVYDVHCYPYGDGRGAPLVLSLGVDVTGRKEAEAALKESESKYRIVADNTHAWEFWLGPDLKSFLYVSPACMRITGRPAQAFVDDPVLYMRIIHPDDRPGFVAHMRRTRRESVSEEVAFRIVRPDGSIRWIGHVCQPVFDADGTYLGVRGSNRDITKRKRAEEAVRASEERYRAVVEEQTELICRWRPDGTLTFVNEAYCRYFGKRKEALLGTSFLFLVPEGEREALRGYIARTLPSLTPADPGVTYEHPVTGPSGEVRWQQWTDRAIFDGEGQLLELQSVGRDITDRKKAELALKESEERFRSLVEHALVGFFLVQEGKVVFQNPEQERIFGTIPEGLTLGDLSARVHPEDRERFAQLTGEAGIGEETPSPEEGDFAKGSRIETDLRFHSHNRPGDPEVLRWVHGRTTPVTYKGRRAFLVNMVDVTRARELERVASLRDKMAVLGQVSAGIAHEIRNPLSGLNLYLSAGERLFADSESLEPEIRESAATVFGMMKTASDKIEAVIRKVLDFARPAPSRLSLVPVNQAVNEAVQLAGTILRRSGIRLETALAEDLPLCYADLGLLEQVILNIVTNAAQAMEGREGEKALRIAAAPEGRDVVIRVADSGPGVPADLRDKIFDPFFTTKEGGTGIGLSFSHRVVADLGGFLDVGDSALGGAEFRIRIPAGDKRKTPRPRP
jgi:PAS domain S-box-containing protein